MGDSLGSLSLESWLVREGANWLGRWHNSEGVLLVERPPRGLALVMTRDVVRALGAPTRWIAPAEWKPWVHSNPLPDGWRHVAKSVHVRDALGMLWWWLHTKDS